jgi:hypothetical protein
MNRKLLWTFVVVGLALVIAPFALSLPSKTAAGERMLNGFRPIMQPSQVALTAQYYNDTFVPLGRVVPMFGQMPVQMQTAFGQMLKQAQVSPTVFGHVPAGLVHYKPLVTTMQANVDNYRQVDSLPNFRLFTWFFVVPGLLVALLALFGLYGDRIHFSLHHARPTAA